MNDSFLADWSDRDAYDDDGYADDGSEDECLADVLAEALSEDYADARPEDVDDALGDMLESLSPAEAFGVTKALQQVGRNTARIASDPAFAQVATSVLPIAGGALGTTVGGPVGTAAGARLGSVAAQSLSKSRRRAPVPVSPASASGGSAAATQALMLTQHPEVLKALLATAMGAHGRRVVDGVPVSALVGMLSSILGRAAADADELFYTGGQADGEDADAFWDGDDASLYTALVDADNFELDEAVGWQ